MKVSNDVDLKQIAEDTELFTGAELEGLCREAGIVALREDISASVVCNRHFQTVWKSLKPVLTREEVNSCSSFMKNPSLISSGSSKASAKQNSKHTTTSQSTILLKNFTIRSFMCQIYFYYRGYLFGLDLGLYLMVLRASVVTGAVNLGCEGVSLEECKGFGCASIKRTGKV
ncbi:hypothetical protein CsSME_00017419 [Camellia sinensis var. sinensis]